MSGYGALEALKDNEMLQHTTFYNYGEKVRKKNNSYSKYPSFKLPTKKEFGYKLKSINIRRSLYKLFYSDTTGGLSDFWSGSISTFSDEELKERGIFFLKKY